MVPRRFLILLLVSLPFFHPFAACCQSNPEWNAARIRLQLEKLNVLGSVLYLAAHPDDENSRLLPFLAFGKKYRTAYLSLTRGDGGQNLIGDEQGELLGLVRTQELLAARGVDGAEQFFTRANDFGFSKTAVETLRFWGRDRILGDIVWVIREFRPDVIICRFPADQRAGHGNHWASAILAHDAFQVAGDPKMFPEQLKWLQPWQPKRLLWNTFSFGSFNTTSPDQFHFDDGGFNSLIGESYGELAGESRSMHKTQGAALSRQRGSSEEYFSTILGTPPSDSLLQGVNTTWGRVDGGQPVGQMVTRAIASFDMDHPAASLPALVTIYKAITDLPQGYRRTEKLKECSLLIQACAGLWLSATTTQEDVPQGGKVRIRFSAINRSDFPIQLEGVRFAGIDSSLLLDLKNNEEASFTGDAGIAADQPVSQPYWLIEPHPDGYYEVPDPRMTGMPGNPPAIPVVFRVRADDAEMEIIRPVQYRVMDPVRGELEEPLVVTPPVTANLSSPVILFPTSEARTIQVDLESFQQNAAGSVSLKLPPGYRSQPSEIPFRLSQPGDKSTLEFEVIPEAGGPANHIDTLTAQISMAGKTYDRGIHVISYSHIPTITIFPKAQARLVRLDLKLGGRRIGYYPGAGDPVAGALKQAGYQVTTLSSADIARGDLSRFDAIITGVRAYNVDPELRYLQDTLLSYVYRGGTLLVQYNKPFPMATSKLGPYPFALSGSRVTDETAQVDFLVPDDPVMKEPNPISEEDFKGWIQERGLYFTQNADAHYRKLFSMHDPGESPLDGSTIVANYGSGKYVYTSLDFFRELPAGVPGAFRLFANLINSPDHR